MVWGSFYQCTVRPPAVENETEAVAAQCAAPPSAEAVTAARGTWWRNSDGSNTEVPND